MSQLTEQEQIAIKKWEKARTRWWIYSPSELSRLEYEARKAYRHLEQIEKEQHNGEIV